MSAVPTIKKRAVFLLAAKNGKRWVSKSLILQALPGGEGLQAGFTVSKKVYKSAVRRNRIRRRLKAAAAEIMPQAKGGTYVIIGRRETLDRSYSDITADLKWCLKKLDCLKE